MDVRTATPADRQALSTTLAAAFAADPVIRWMVPSPRRDVPMFRAMAAHLHGAPGGADIAVEDGAAVGAALWDPPGYRLPVGSRIAGLVSLLVAMRWPGFRRGAVVESTLAKARPAGKVWYLANLGATTPGRGIGSALLEHRLSTITGPAYLESSNERNVPLYERFGFEVVRDITLPEGGPTLWTMLRR